MSGKKSEGQMERFAVVLFRVRFYRNEKTRLCSAGVIQ